MSHPRKIETVYIETLAGELCIYDWQRLEVHALNPTAALVWELCDGQASPRQMAAQLRLQLKGDLTPAQAEELVWLTLKRLEKTKLLQNEVVKPAGHKILTRRELLKGLGVAAALLPVVSSIVAPGPVEAQSPGLIGPGGCSAPLGQSQTFNFTGAEQQFIVPAGVTCVTIQADGAHGGAINNAELGGRTTATISVTPGETLFVYVGGQPGGPPSGSGGAGGFNGGGAGGAAPIGGWGGGGASDVRQGGNGLNHRVVVAGGGGGMAGTGSLGGAGGGPDGLPGFQPGDGDGGTQTSGGAGGSGLDGGNNGTAGTFGIGGAGGSSLALGGVGGGGGGGGYYGGGGGGGDNNTGTLDGGGGGGGSGFVIPTATNVSAADGVRTGNGQVIISW